MVVLGIAQAGDLKKVGRVGIKAVLYFEVVTGFALLIGVILAYALQPGVGMNIDPSTLDASAMSAYADRVSDVKHGTARFPDEDHPDHSHRRFRQGRYPASAAVRDPVRRRLLLPG